MNERIKELAEQSMIETDHELGGKYLAFSKEKFAHLIIEDCKKAFWSEDCFVSDLAIDDYNKQAEKIRKRYED